MKHNIKPKIIFIMGATGTGKSKLSIDIATRFPAEIINSDKIQAYEGLDIVTNKLHESERGGIPHHLLGFISNADAEFTAEDFCRHVNYSITCIIDRGHTPIIVGGSNSYIEALVDADFHAKFSSCFIWLDVQLPILFEYVEDRVDQMVEAGLVDEIREFFKPGLDYSRGIHRAIGVQELEKYLLVEKEPLEECEKEGLLSSAIEETKLNTKVLVRRQIEKIHRMRNQLGWEIHRIDPTAVLERRWVASEKEAAWNELVLKPSLKIVENFRKEDHDDHDEEDKKIKNVENINRAQFRNSSPVFVM